MVHVYERVVYIVPVASLAILFALLNTTNPVSIGPGGILLIFVITYLFFVSVFFIILRLGLAAVGRVLQRRRGYDARMWRIGVRKAYYVATVAAFAPVCLLAMQSIGQLQLRDILLITAFEIVAVFYILKRR